MEPYYPREAEPATLEQAIQYAAYYFWDSGFTAFVAGYCFGQGMEPVKISELLSVGKEKLNRLCTQGQLDTVFDYR
jgi:hypothetical protein